MGRSGGFFVGHRQVEESDLYLALTSGQRGIFWDLIRCANWKPGVMFYAGKWLEIRRGELGMSLETLTKPEHCNTSIKALRLALAKFMAPGPNGEDPFIKERYSGTERGTGFRVLTIVNYDKYQSTQSPDGTGVGTTRAQEGARNGAQDGAPIEPVNQLTKEPKKQRPAQKAPPNPRHAPLIARLVEAFQAEKREAYPFDGKKHPPAVSRLLALCDSDDRIVAAWRRSIALAPKWPGTCDLAAFASRLPEFSGAAPPGKQPVIAPMSKEFREEDKPF